ncbi:PREDICTED: nardilysin-like [Trachymyrmex septentrionalis]|uniref:nardilysin-like n=1 Tax=Trachymyrmex septentrionalis TaxID=34720 RepID=UPI00084EFC39|nr:PREDICTED: nardilysin-like [Trachymyrmex septentrionalis]
MQEGENNRSCQVEYLETPVKLENDKKEYRAIRLPNGLEALLISDEISKTSFFQHQAMKNEMKVACCLCVRTGFFEEPPEFRSISFFFESMLLTEFTKHCEKHDFKKLFDKHGGSYDFSLDYEYTLFKFDIQKKHFLSVLIPFAEFFINPLPEKDAFMQDQNDINEEFRRALNFAKNRVPQPQLSSFTRTDHPINQIIEDRIIKEYENLGYSKLYEELHKFKERHYSARRIKLVIQASLPLNTLEQYVTIDTCFVNIPTNELSPDDSTELIKNNVPFDSAAFHRIYKISPSKHVGQLEITWVMPSLYALYKSKPHKYISWLIRHEGKGSLISYLRKNMWNITRSSEKICQNIDTFTYSVIKVTIDLSNEGKQCVKKVLDAIFSYINLLKKESLQKEIYDEFSKSEENIFRTFEARNPRNNVSNLSMNLHQYPSRDYITGSKTCEYDSEAITKILNYLTPETANIMIFDNDFGNLQLNKIDSWSKALYTDVKIPHEWLEHWKSVEPLPNFCLPEQNVWTFSEHFLDPLFVKVPKYPIKLYSNSISELWYRPDPKFRLPNMYTHFISSLGLQSPENAALMTVYCNIIQFLMMEELYPALESGYTYDISVSEKGIIIKISGPMPIILLLTIIKYIICPDVKKEMFEIIRNQQVRIYNDTFTKPGKLAEDVKLWILKLVHYTYVDMHNALQNVSFEEFRNFVKCFTNRLYIQCLVQGNITQDEAIESMQQCIETLKCNSLHSNMMQPNRVFQLPLGTSYYKLKNINKYDSTSVVINTYQIDVTSIELSVLMRLIFMIMEKQLSLKFQSIQDDLIQHTSCDWTDIDGILEYSISATQSLANKLYTTEDIKKWIDDFLEFFGEFLNEFSENDLDDVKERIFKQYADMNIEEEINRNWNEIMKCQYMFDRHEREILALDKIKINELREWFNKYTWNENYMKQLSVHIIGTHSDKVQSIALEYIIDEHQYKNPEEKYITKVGQYKKNLYVYPVIEGYST